MENKSEIIPKDLFLKVLQGMQSKREEFYGQLIKLQKEMEGYTKIPLDHIKADSIQVPEALPTTCLFLHETLYFCTISLKSASIPMEEVYNAYVNYGTKGESDTRVPLFMPKDEFLEKAKKVQQIDREYLQALITLENEMIKHTQIPICDIQISNCEVRNLKAAITTSTKCSEIINPEQIYAAYIEAKPIKA